MLDEISGMVGKVGGGVGFGFGAGWGGGEKTD